MTTLKTVTKGGKIAANKIWTALFATTNHPKEKLTSVSLKKGGNHSTDTVSEVGET